MFCFVPFPPSTAGDHVKFGFPMASSLTIVAWGMVQYREAFENVITTIGNITFGSFNVPVAERSRSESSL
jgi:hypothetical protein